MDKAKEFRVVKGESCLGSWTTYEPALKLFNQLKEVLSKGERLEVEEVKEGYVETVISQIGWIRPCNGSKSSSCQIMSS